MMKWEFLEPDSPDWQDVLARVDHDFYHLPGYLLLSARQEQGKPSPSWPGKISRGRP